MKIRLTLLAIIFCSAAAFSQTITVSGSTTFCNGGSVLLTAPTGTAYQWQQGSSPIGGATNQTYTATASGSYWVIVTIAGTPANSDTVVVTVNPNPVPSFTFTNNICSGVDVQFTSNVTNGTPPYTYSWHFGDGSSSNAVHPVHAFTSLGCGTTVFQDTLIVTDANGCTGRVINPVTILQAPDVQLQDDDLFTPFSNCDHSPTPANPNFTLIVNNISPSIGCITSYTLNWGDGNIETGLTTASFPRTHDYTQLGAFDLVITAVGINGCVHSKTYPVANQVNPSVSLGTFGPLMGCDSVRVGMVIGLWTTNSPGTTYLLEFGDGASVQLNHPINPNYTDDTVYHTYRTTSCPDSIGFKPRVIAKNYCKTTPIIGPPIQVWKKPQADFSLSPNPVCINQAVQFSNATIVGYYDNCSTATIYNWNFGDPASGSNNTSTSNNPPPHIFTSPGTYTITLTTTNPCGSTTMTKQVCVTAAPVASFNVDAVAICANAIVNTTNTSIASTCPPTNYVWSVSYAAGFCGTSAAWNFTNGTTATSSNPSFIFTNPGTYTLTLTISSPCGNTIAQRIIKVKQPPTVSLPVISDACGLAIICPNATIVNCGDSSLIYSWLFDGIPGSNSTSANPGCIPFVTPGVHTVSLAVTNECGTTMASRQFTIKPIPDLSIPASITFCPGATTGNFVFASTAPGVQISWTNNNTSIGLGSNGTGNINPFTTINSGTVSATAIITVIALANGCTKQLSFAITVNPKPLPPVAATPVNYCKDAIAIPLTATASAGNALLWYTTATGGTGNTIAPTPVTNTIGTTTWYVSQVNVVTGCESNRSAITVNVWPIPSIAGSNSSNPTACSTATGTITLNGLTPSTSYTVQYTFNSNPVTVSIISDASGNITITGLTAGIYNNIHVTLNGCLSNSTGPFTLTDPNPPATPVAASNGPVCEGQSLNLTTNSATPGVSYSWTGPGGFTSPQQNPVINPVTIIANGIYTVTTTLNNCHSIPASVDVLIYPRPLVQAVPNTITVCSSDNIQLQSSSNFAGAITYTWTGPNGFTSNLQNPLITGATTAMSGTYIVVVTSTLGNCTSPPATVNVTVNQRPNISNSVSANPTACGTATGSIVLNGLIPSVSYNVNYLKNGNPVTVTLTANSSGNVIINGLTAATYTNITVTVNSCGSNSAGPFILSDPNPPAAPAISSNAPICQGDNLQLNSTSTPGSTYSWTGPNGFTSSLQNPGIIAATLAANGIYNATATLNNCHSLPSSITVLINPRPAAASVQATINVCAGDTLKLTSSSIFAGALTYSWTGPNGFTSVLQNPFIPNASPAMIGAYSLVITSVLGNCPSPPAITNVAVLPLPNVSSSSHINPIGCGTATGSIILNGLTALATYTVYYSKNGGAPISVNVIANNAGSAIIGGLTAGIYNNVVISLNGCPVSLPFSFLLKDTAPFSVLAENNGPVCENNNLVLTAEITTIGGATYAWNGPNGFTSNIQSPVIPNASPINNGIYYVAVTVDGCTSTDSVTATISSHSVGGNTRPDATVCRGKNHDIINLSGNLGQIERWEYSINNGLTWSPIDNASFFLTYNNLTITTWYRAVIKNGACPSVYSNITKITVLNSVQSVTFTPRDTGICVHDTTILFRANPVYTGNDPISYYWYINGQIQGTTNPFSWHFQVPLNDLSVHETTIKVLAENSFGCGDTSAAGKLIIYPLPVIIVTKSNDITCSKGYSNLAASGASQYFWRTKDSVIGLASGITVTPRESTTYYLRAVSQNQCIKEDSIRVFVNKNGSNGDYTLPNAFTPNDDGLNDRIGAAHWGYVEGFELSIFNRWGQLVFHTRNVLDSWDGKFNGKKQGSGVFVYTITGKTICDDEKKVRKGTIVLIRKCLDPNGNCP